METEANPVHSALFFASHRLLGSLKIIIQSIQLAPRAVSELEEKAKNTSDLVFIYLAFFGDYKLQSLGHL